MKKESVNSIAGMSLGGGKKENFFFCQIEFYEEKKRWFLTSLKQVKDESELSQDEVITSWIDGLSVNKLIVNFPLTKPPCETCDLVCPGVERCHHPVVNNVIGKMKDLMAVDKERVVNNPKKYEQERVEDSLIHYTRSVLEKETHDHILSKAFKRRLKKGFVPYWNRPLDFWIWTNYYDQMLKTFNSAYDSFGNVSVMLLYKFNYLLRHLPKDLNIFESSSEIVLLELYRAKIISKKNIAELKDIDVATLARVKIAKEIEQKLNIFIYKNDLDILSKNPKAFDSFLLAICGQSFILDKVRDLPRFGSKEDPRFIAPYFETLDASSGQDK